MVLHAAIENRGARLKSRSFGSVRLVLRVKMGIH
jgi:hypothetical protein